MLCPGVYCLLASHPEREARVEEDRRAEEDPVAERVHARERHVPRADHQGDQVVPERPGRHRDDEEEDHRQAVEREELVVGARRDEVVVRLDQLRPHHHRLDAAGAEQDERRPEVEEADPLVVGRRQPAEHAWPALPHHLEPVHSPSGGRSRRRCDRHYFSSSK
jgi:hypothetical protein